MADTIEQLDPQYQAAPFIPPFPTYLSSEKEFMKSQGWTPLNGDLGVGFQARMRYGLTSQEEDQTFLKMQQRAQLYQDQREAWVKAHAQNFAKTLGDVAIGSLVSPGSPAQPSQVESPFGAAYNIQNPGPTGNIPYTPEPLGSANPQQPIRPPMSALEGLPYSQAKPAQPAMLGSVPLDERTASLLKGPLGAMRVDPAHALNLLTANQIMSPEEKQLFGLEGAGNITAKAGEKYASLREKQIEAAGRAEQGKGALPQLQDRRLRLEAQLEKKPDDARLQRDLTDINEKIKVETTSQREGVNANRIAQVYGAKDFDSISDKPMTAADVMRIKRLEQQTGTPYVAEVGLSMKAAADATLFKRQIAITGAQAAAQQAVQLSAPVPVERRTNIVSRQAFINTGDMQPAPAGISEKAVRTGDYVEIGDQQKKKLEGLIAARSNADMLFGMAQELFTETNPAAAKAQGANLFIQAKSGINPTAAAYLDGREAFSSQTARAVGGEVGVMTNQDILRWERALPGFGDTADIIAKKRQTFDFVQDASMKAQRAVIAGGDPVKIRAELKRQIDPKLKQVEKLSPPVPASTDILNQADLILKGK